jgi:hypothetical protein
MRMLVRNRFDVGITRLPAAAVITTFSVGNSILALWQRLLHGRKIAQTPIEPAPLFILGHWRSGTTMLHELLALDERNSCPSTFQCMAPHHFLVSEGFITRYFKWMLPAQRPMDNVPVGYERPQEDEFALCALGLPSPYWTMAFPNHPPQWPEYLDLETLAEADRRRWLETLRHFVQMVAYKKPGRVVLKSPPHTARVKALLEAFPDARFVHILRDPFVLFQSTVNMWKKMYQMQYLHRPNFAWLEEHVFDSFVRMYRAFEAARPMIPPRRLYEVRYEDLVRDTVGQLRGMYEQLELGDFEPLLPALEKWQQETADYRTNRYQMPPELQDRIRQRWGEFIERFGYAATAHSAP